MRTAIATMLLVVCGAVDLAAQDAASETTDLEITRAVTATGVEDREPVGVASVFPASVGTVYFYTVFEGDVPETEVDHVWLRDGEEVARIPLRVRGPRWRTWSSKQIPAAWSGTWTVRVEVVDGTVLERVEFQVGE